MDVYFPVLLIISITFFGNLANVRATVVGMVNYALMAVFVLLDEKRVWHLVGEADVVINQDVLRVS